MKQKLKNIFTAPLRLWSRFWEKQTFFKRLDTYIIGKYLGTFFFCLLMVMAIVVVFDYNEKFDKFNQNGAPARAIIFDYFANFIPYFALKFSSLFIFISVIYFTSKMASNTEIIAILAGGTSFQRLMRPYLISATFLAVIIFFLSSFLIPPGNKTRLDFEDQYVRKVTKDYVRNIQLEIEPGVIVYIERYDERRQTGYNFFLEHYDGKHLISRMTAKRVTLNANGSWKASDYMIRDFDGMVEHVSEGATLDTIVAMDPSEFYIVEGFSEQLTTKELDNYLDRQRQRGVANIQEYELEYHRRFSFPFSIIILTVIGVSLASRKVRGGTGLHLGVGLAIAFSYILFDTLSGSLALSGTTTPLMAVWIPNLLYAVIAVYLYAKAPK